jgi:hypothetical protein
MAFAELRPPLRMQLAVGGQGISFVVPLRQVKDLLVVLSLGVFMRNKGLPILEGLAVLDVG